MYRRAEDTVLLLLKLDSKELAAGVERCGIGTFCVEMRLFWQLLWWVH